jgi:hypothetical protein
MTDAAQTEKRGSDRFEVTPAEPGPDRLYYGTREGLRSGDVVSPSDPFDISSDSEKTTFTYISPDLDAATWSAELADGDGSPRVYVVEAEGSVEDASELIGANAPPHPHMSWRSSGEVRVKSEVAEWTWYHGTRAKLKAGDMLVPGSDPNYGQTLNHVYLTRTLDAAIWAAELALGDGPQRIYIVEATGPVEDDPNVTDKRFRGNPSKSFRSRDPLRVIGEITGWKGHPEEAVKAMKAGIQKLAQQGHGPINEVLTGDGRHQRVRDRGSYCHQTELHQSR